MLPVHLDALEMALAVAESHTGDAPFAARRARSVVDRAERGGVSGIVLVDLYAADASIVVAAEALRTTQIFTLDRADFTSYRVRLGRTHRAFRLLTPEQ